jgi:hypothetical protein
MMWFTQRKSVIHLNDCEVLSEIRIDAYHFKITWTPLFRDGCVLWFLDERVDEVYEALGRFSRFDRKRILDFVVRYTTSENLRREIEGRKFENRLGALSPSFFTRIRGLSQEQKVTAFRYLFDLDDAVEEHDLVRKRRIMARKFHPDRGGAPQAMSVVNEAYEFLLNSTRA